MEEAQKKAKRAKLPVLDIDPAMYATTSVLQSGDYTKEPTSGKAMMPTQRLGLSGNMPTWLRTSGASTASMLGL